MNIRVRCNNYHYVCKYNTTELMKDKIDSKKLLDYLKYVTEQEVKCYIRKDITDAITYIITDHKDILCSEHYPYLAKTKLISSSVYDKFYPEIFDIMIRENDTKNIRSYIERDDVVITEDNIREYMKQKYSNLLLIKLIDIYGKNNISEKLFEDMFYYFNGNKLIEYLKSLINLGIKITDNAFYYTIFSHRYELARYILDNGNVYPIIKYLEFACLFMEKELIIKLLNYKLIPNKTCFKNIFSSLEYTFNKWLSINDAPYSIDNNKVMYRESLELLEILLNHSYDLTYEDILYLVSIHVKVDDISRFAFDFDIRYLEECFKANYFPYDIDPNLIEPSLECMYRECGVYDDGRITWSTENQIIPDNTCTENLCKSEDNISAIIAIPLKFLSKITKKK